MNTVILSAISMANEFTGFEHTRIAGLLTVLAFISIGMWGAVVISMIIRQAALLIMRLLRYGKSYYVSIVKNIGGNHGA
jgi:hypothetical protein